jgi:hypothetical protein
MLHEHNDDDDDEELVLLFPSCTLEASMPQSSDTGICYRSAHKFKQQATSDSHAHRL